MTEQTTLDPTRRYLVPVARLLLPEEPDLVHLSVYEWLPRWEEWATGLALCGRSTEQGALTEGTAVTCPDCQAYREKYQTALDAQHRALEDAQRLRTEKTHAADTPENGAWFTVWLQGDWNWVTKNMTTEQREYAADRVEAYSRYLAEVDGDSDRSAPEGLRWWREAGR